MKIVITVILKVIFINFGLTFSWNLGFFVIIHKILKYFIKFLLEPKILCCITYDKKKLMIVFCWHAHPILK